MKRETLRERERDSDRERERKIESVYYKMIEEG